MVILQQEIELVTGSYRLLNGVIRLKFEDRMDGQFTIEDAKEHLSARLALAKNRRIPLLFDIRNATTVIPLDILKFWAASEDLEKIRSARAYLSNSLHTKLSMNFYSKLINDSHPTKWFAKEKEAIEWLTQFV